MSPDAGWRLEFVKRAVKDLQRLDKKTQARIGRAIDELIQAPPTGDIRRLAGVEPTEYRLRVGDWPVRSTRDEVVRVVAIQRVFPRGHAYRD